MGVDPVRQRYAAGSAIIVFLRRIADDGLPRTGAADTRQKSDAEEAWKLEPVEPVEEREKNLAELKEEEPFQVLNEPAGPREDDSEKL